MTFVRKSYNEIVESVISQITKGIVNEKHEFATNRIKYRLIQSEVVDIVKVEGILKGNSSIFRKDVDYRLNNDMIEWLREGEKPEDHTPFFVSYRLYSPQLITDVNPGSVIRTIVESIALEIDFLYAQMDQVYNSAFINTATGKSLDLVVSILGINRKAAGFATGEVTFGRNSDPGEIEVLREAHIYNGDDIHELKNTMIKNIKKIDGIVKKVSTVFIQDQDYNLSNNAVQWIDSQIEGKENKKPDIGSLFYIDYATYEQIIIPADTRISTYSRRSENVKIFRTTRDAILNKNIEGNWSIDIPVIAMSPGKEGNVFAGTINVMPKPPIGIEYVINKSDILNGTDTENDSELRQRAVRALEMAGKATLTSLTSAIQGVSGVIGNVRVVDQPDGVPGIVQIIASGGDENEIKRVIDDARSAGIKVEFKRPTIVPLDIKLTIFLVEGMDNNEIIKSVDSIIRQYLGKLDINEDVILSRIIKSALSILGVRDIRDIVINSQNENIDIKPDEKGELRTLEIFIGD